MFSGAAGEMAVGGVDEEGYGAVVLEGDLHLFLEAAGGDGQAGVPVELDGVVVERLGLLRGRGLGEGGTAAFAGVGVEGELADDEEFGAGVEGGVVEAVLAVGEDAEVDGFVDEVLGIGGGVGGGDAKEDEEAGADAAGFPAVDGYGGVGYALEEGAHRATVRGRAAGQAGELAAAGAGASVLAGGESGAVSADLPSVSAASFSRFSAGALGRP